MRCGSMLNSTLLYADDAFIFVEDEKSIRYEVDMLEVASRSECSEMSGHAYKEEGG